MDIDKTLTFLNENAGLLTLVFSFIVTVSTAVYAWLTWWLVKETSLLREAATEPSLSVHIALGERGAPSVMQLVIANHGRGTATAITWEVSPSLEFLQQHGVKLDNLQLLNGLPQLAPGQQIRAFFGESPDLFDEPICPDISLTARYQSSTGKRYKSRFILSPAQFRGYTMGDDFFDAKIARSLEKIERALTRVIFNKRLRVATVTESELQEERRKLAESIRDAQPEKNG
jgi:hypothetical protein